MASVVFYEEEQRNPGWLVWVIVLFGLGMLVFTLTMTLQQWENSGTMSRDVIKLMVAAGGIVVTIGVVSWLVTANRLTVHVNKEGITYQLFPNCLKSKHIPVEAIASYELRKMTSMEQFYAGGTYRPVRSKFFNHFSPGKEYNILLGCKVADVKLKDGRRILLGTRNPDGMLWAMKKLLSGS